MVIAIPEEFPFYTSENLEGSAFEVFVSDSFLAISPNLHYDKEKSKGTNYMKITIIDGQGGRIGRTIIEQLKKKHPDLELYAIGTNSAATASMLKAGADYGATGDNAVIVNAADSDLIVGPIGIVFANALLGEITPAIAAAIGASKAFKILIPVSRCNHYIAGCDDLPLGDYIRSAVEKVDSLL